MMRDRSIDGFRDLAHRAHSALVVVHTLHDLAAFDPVSRDAFELFDRARTGALLRARSADLAADEERDVVRLAVDWTRMPASDPAGTFPFQQARVTLGIVPDVPWALVTWRPLTTFGYSDLGRPRSLGELVTRLEDNVHAVWTLSGHRDPSQPRLRRLYAFFEAAALWSDPAASTALRTLGSVWA